MLLSQQLASKLSSISSPFRGSQKQPQQQEKQPTPALCPRLLDYVIITGRRPNARVKRPPQGGIAGFFSRLSTAAASATGYSSASRGGAIGVIDPPSAARLSSSHQQASSSSMRNNRGWSTSASGGVSRPELLRRYPNDNHNDFPLPPDIGYFCQPEGCLTIGPRERRRQQHLRHRLHEANSFVFTLTDKDSNKIRYGISLNFFLELPAAASNAYQTFLDPESAESQQQKQTPNKTASTLTSICILSHHPFVSSFRDVLMLFRQLVDASNTKLNRKSSTPDPTGNTKEDKETPLTCFELKLPKDAVWLALLGHWPHQGQQTPAVVLDEVRQLETWLLTLLSAPVPVPGKTNLRLQLLPATLMPVGMQFALPDRTRFSLVDFPLHLPIEVLGIDTCVQLLGAIMLEHKVVLQSRNYNAVSICVLALVTLLYPLEYMFPVIPLLPVFMPSAEQLLLAPTPYIIGVPASFFQCKAIQVPCDVLLVDLDTNEMQFPTESDGRTPIQISKFPEPESSQLKRAFRDALDKVRLSSGSRCAPPPAPRVPTALELNDGSAFTDTQIAIAGSSSSKKSETLKNSSSVDTIDDDADAADVAVRVAMIEFYNGPNIFANFSEHSRTVRLYPRPVVALRTDSFLRSRPIQSPFTEELCKTQAVEYFAECSISPPNDVYVRVQAGTKFPLQVGDKGRWFVDQLTCVEYSAYPVGLALAETLAAVLEANASKGQMNQLMTSASLNRSSVSDEDDSIGAVSDHDSINGGSSTPGGVSGVQHQCFADEVCWTPRSTRSINSNFTRPLTDAGRDTYREPKTICFIQQQPSQAITFASGLSSGDDDESGRSSPLSNISASTSGALDSDMAEFACLASNLALKRDAKGDFSFEQTLRTAASAVALDTATEPPDAAFSTDSQLPTCSSSSNEYQQTKHLIGRTSGGVGSKFFFARGTSPLQQLFNGYAERSQNVFSQVKEKARPLAQAAASRIQQHKQSNGTAKADCFQNNPHSNPGESQAAIHQPQAQDSTAQAAQQQKNHAAIMEACEVVLAGQSIGLFAFPKIRRLLEDESLRELTCQRLNQGLSLRYAEDEFFQNVQLTRNQYKGFLKLLQACVQGLEQSFQTPSGSSKDGLASAFHVLEIAHTHFWASHDSGAAGSGGSSNSLMGTIGTPGTALADAAHSLMSTPSASSYNLLLSQHSTSATSSSQAVTTVHEKPETPPPADPAPSSHLPPTMVPPALPAQSPLSTHKRMPPSQAPPPLPPRPPINVQQSIIDAPPLPSRPPPLPPRLCSTKPSKIHDANKDVLTSDLCQTNAAEMLQQKSTMTSLSTNTEHVLLVDSSTPPQTNPRNSSPFHSSAASTPRKPSELEIVASRPQAPTSLELSVKDVAITPIAAASEQQHQQKPSMLNHFLYQDLTLSSAVQVPIWQNMDFWDNAFLDIVAQEVVIFDEREKIGMDQEPCELLERYAKLNEAERRRLELEEDRLLAMLLHNMTAFMIMCRVPVKSIQQKIRRLLGKAHIGLIYSKKINQLLDDVAKNIRTETPKNGRTSLSFSEQIPLRPLGSRLVKKDVFTVHELIVGLAQQNDQLQQTQQETSVVEADSLNASQSVLLSEVEEWRRMCFFEVCEDAIIIRDPSTGAMAERWWFESVVNMTYSPRSRMLCLWRRQEGLVQMHKFHAKKCFRLYTALKLAMGRAAGRGKLAVRQEGQQDLLGGEFPVHDVDRCEGGLLRVRLDGIHILFAHSQQFIKLNNIRKCNTLGNTFILEELEPESDLLVQRQFFSSMALPIMFQLHRVFSVVHALVEATKTMEDHSKSSLRYVNVNLCEFDASNSAAATSRDAAAPDRRKNTNTDLTPKLSSKRRSLQIHRTLSTNECYLVVSVDEVDEEKTLRELPELEHSNQDDDFKDSLEVEKSSSHTTHELKQFVYIITPRVRRQNPQTFTAQQSSTTAAIPNDHHRWWQRVVVLQRIKRRLLKALSTKQRMH